MSDREKLGAIRPVVMGLWRELDSGATVGRMYEATEIALLSLVSILSSPDSGAGDDQVARAEELKREIERHSYKLDDYNVFQAILSALRAAAASPESEGAAGEVLGLREQVAMFHRTHVPEIVEQVLAALECDAGDRQRRLAYYALRDGCPKTCTCCTRSAPTEPARGEAGAGERTCAKCDAAMVPLRPNRGLWWCSTCLVGYDESRPPAAPPAPERGEGVPCDECDPSFSCFDGSAVCRKYPADQPGDEGRE